MQSAPLGYETRNAGQTIETDPRDDHQRPDEYNTSIKEHGFQCMEYFSFDKAKL